MKVTFLGATGTVTGSKSLVESAGIRLLVDCGLFQGLKDLRLRNWSSFPVDPASVSAVILTHAHIDHSGYLPLLVRMGFSGKIYCSEATLRLCEILLPDAGRLQEEEAAIANQMGYSKHARALPLFSEKDARASLTHFSPVDMNCEFQIGDVFKARLIPAGHILGASIVRLEDSKTSLTFSGDLGRPHDLLMRPPKEIADTDYLVLESTYGDRLHPKIDILDQLEEVIQRVAGRGGKIIIPAFSVGRAQLLLYALHLLKKQNRIPSLPIFLDSPMSYEATKVFCHHVGHHRLNQEQCQRLSEVASYVADQGASEKLDSYAGPMILVSASGMATGGRVLHHLKALLPDSKNAVLLAGFQAEGTRGASLLNGSKRVKIRGEEISVQAEIVNLENLSAHADQAEVLDWARKIKKAPRKVFITHGEKKPAAALAQVLREQLGWKCEEPKYLQSFELS